jgi:hypothetical protein
VDLRQKAAETSEHPSGVCSALTLPKLPGIFEKSPIGGANAPIDHGSSP